MYQRLLFHEGGSKFYDKSALYHIHGERKFSLDTINIFNWILRAGGNYRMYTPFSKGILFERLHHSGVIYEITNQEGGIYLGLEKDFMDEKLKDKCNI